MHSLIPYWEGECSVMILQRMFLLNRMIRFCSFKVFSAALRNMRFGFKLFWGKYLFYDSNLHSVIITVWS
jgi:hypothetical protein